MYSAVMMASCVFSSGDRAVVLGPTLVSGPAAPSGQDLQVPAKVAMIRKMRWAKRLLKISVITGQPRFKFNVKKIYLDYTELNNRHIIVHDH